MTPPPGPPLRWHERVDVPMVLSVLAIAAVVWAASGVALPERPVDVSGSARRMLERFLSPDFSDARLWPALLETLRIAVIATAVAGMAALPLGLLGSRQIAGAWIALPTRMLLAGLRTVPSLVWAILAVAFIGLGAPELCGVVALTAYSLGYLAKFYADSVDSVDVAAARALRSAGASRMQVVRHGYWPEIRPQVWSHALWMLEYNIRSGTIIGLVGAGGLGLLLQDYLQVGDWHRLSALLCVLIGVVVLLDLVGDRLRAALLRQG